MDAEEEKRIRNLTVIQDFNNKKANAHATIFVASMFALFTVLSLAQRIVTKVSSNCSIPNFTVLWLSIVSYLLIWVFGLYSMLNFTYYSTVSQRAEEKIVGDMERQLISSYKKGWKGVFKLFASFKVPDGDQGFIRRNNEWMSIIIYSTIGLLPFIAFIIWVFSG